MPKGSISFPCDREQSVLRGRGRENPTNPCCNGRHSFFAHVLYQRTGGYPVPLPLVARAGMRCRGHTGSWLWKAGEKRFPRETTGCKTWVHGRCPGREMLASSSVPYPARRKPLRGHHPKKKRAGETEVFGDVPENSLWHPDASQKWAKLQLLSRGEASAVSSKGGLLWELTWGAAGESERTWH